MKGNSAFVGEFSLDPTWMAGLDAKSVSRQPVPVSSHAASLQGLLGADEVGVLTDVLNSRAWVPVGVDGIKSHYTPGDRIGSWRASCFEPAFVEALYTRMKGVMPDVWTFDGTTTENAPYDAWRFVGINPLCRFIKYEQGGALVPHYDWAFQAEGSPRKTLVSLVVYLTAPQTSGRTRFIKDEKAGVPVAQRDLADWTRFPRSDEVVYAHQAMAGNALCFEHSLLHDSEDHHQDDPKIIMRTDLVFEPVM